MDVKIEAEKQFKEGENFETQGELVKAVDQYFQALSLNPAEEKYWANFAFSIRFLEFSSANEKLRQTVLSCFSKKNVNFQNLAIPGHSILKLSKEYNELLRVSIDSNEQILWEKFWKSGIMKNELFLSLLKHCIIPDFHFENLCTKLRKKLLQTCLSKNDEKQREEEHSDRFELALALASHCFITEYVYSVTESEEDDLLSLENTIYASMKSGETLDPVLSEYLAVFGSYKNLSKQPFATKILTIENGKLRDLIQQQIREPFKEESLKSEIPLLKAISDDVSLNVKDQYEKNPYPRWNAPVKKTPKDFLTFLSELFPYLDLEVSHKPLHVLIAGCGTGQHAINAALSYKNCHVIAVDLSRTSLAYAKRKQEELGIHNIEFIQADILDLEILDSKFDVIECVGVLHHMKNPIEGWKVLNRLLKKNGFLNIGLYSEKARQDVVAARKLIKKNGYKPTIEDIRKCRQQFFHLSNGNIIKELCKSIDFFTVSSCRDLMFHVQEHRFTIPQIAKIISGMNLQFLGFDLPDKKILNEFKNMFPSDERAISLENWNTFEEKYPLTFLGMYQFWLAKLE